MAALLAVHTLIALFTGAMAAGRIWERWFHPGHPRWVPLARTPLTWFAMTFLFGPFAWGWYVLYRHYAPRR